ncbi:pancreatic lipase-related protein 2-like [Salmo trutta]|uniref:pancreatic lipase-related protein 2-like n=1 Tax=Salmo trutta TaxID=8032 RepID=UPI001132355A|nr:pancreatic lipase-related protein 2-like [Salmo trutta]
MSIGRRLAWPTLSDNLGADAAGKVGCRINRLGLITGLDPAQPCFQGLIIHTDTLPFIPYVGKGISQAVGHIDLYPNGGEHMPGWDKNIVSTIVDIDCLWEGEN